MKVPTLHGSVFQTNTCAGLECCRMACSIEYRMRKESEVTSKFYFSVHTSLN